VCQLAAVLRPPSVSLVRSSGRIVVVQKTLEQLAGNGYTARLLLPAEFIWRVFRF